MKFNIKYIAMSLLAATMLVSCGDDDDAIIPGSDDDGMQQLDFTGTYNQTDIMGRAGVNTVFGMSDARKDQYNVSTPAQQAIKTESGRIFLVSAPQSVKSLICN